jgi:hypothetical protein
MVTDDESQSRDAVSMPEEDRIALVAQPGEINLGTWSIFYLPPVGRGYGGALTVTDRRLVYEAKFDASFKSLMAGVRAVHWASEGRLEIDKANIQSVEIQQKSTSKRCILTLTDGSKHAFENPSMDATVAAIKSRSASAFSQKYPFVRTLGTVVASTLLYLVIFGILATLVGAALDFFSDVIGSLPSHRSNSSPAAFYTLAFVFGVLCGGVSYQSAAETISANTKTHWLARKGLGNVGLAVIVMTGPVLVAVLAPFLMIASADNSLAEVSLPLTYLASVFASEVFFCLSFRRQ